MKLKGKSFTVILVAAVACAAALALAASDVGLMRQVHASGGGELNASGISLRGTVGQPAVTRVWVDGKIIWLQPGFWLPSSGVSGVGNDDLPVSRGPALQVNVPNPFNPVTEVRFDVGPEAARVRLRIYDTSGRLVRTLVNGVLPAGPGGITWRGKNDAGGSVPSGLYFARLMVDDKQFTRKMMLVR